MGILSRFKDIMASNINALLDKAEDPEKMVDQTLRNLNSDLAKVKSETASVMADEAKAKRNLDEVNAEIAKMQGYAEKAVLAGNDMVMISNPGKAVDDIKKAVDDGKIDEEIINHSVMRILAWKYAKGMIK